MTYEDLKKLFAEGDFSKIYKVLASQKKQTDIETLKKEWSPKLHKVKDPAHRKDRLVEYEDDNGAPVTKVEYVSRIPLSIQKSIVGKAVAFLFGNPVNLTAQSDNDKAQKGFDAIKRIWEDNKIDGKNKLIARQLFRSTEVAEIWHVVDSTAHSTYGFNVKARIRVTVVSPWDGHTLYPYFDVYGDMIAFSREYAFTDLEGQTVKHFEIYTADWKYIWEKKQDGSVPELVFSKENPLKKIPVVYTSQEEADWEDVQAAIERLETLISNHADTNDYNGSPMLVSEGKITSMGSKGEQGKIVEMEKGGKLSYLSWDHAPESIKLEIDNLLNFIRTFTQTPDLSFDSVKGLSSISGIALKLLFMDAHLKVMDKREIFDPYLTRRTNLLKALVSELNSDLSKELSELDIETQIVPFMIEDEMARIKSLVDAAGGKAAISQQTLVEKAGLVTDSVTEYERLQEEFERENSFSIAEPTL